MFSRKGKNFFLSYSLFLVCLLLIYFLLPDNNYKLIAMGILPLLFWLPGDIKKARERRSIKRTQSNSHH